MADSGPNRQCEAYFAIVMLWGGFAVLLALLGSVWQQAQLRTLGYVVGVSAISLLLFDAAFSGLEATPLANLRFAAFAVISVSLIGATAILRRNDDGLSPWENELPGTFLFTAAALALWGLTQEIYEACEFYRASLDNDWQSVAFYAIAILWSYAALLLTVLGHRHAQSDLRALAYTAGCFAVPLLLFNAVAVTLEAPPLFNLRFATFALCVGAFVAVTSRLHRYRNTLAGSEIMVSGLFGLLATLLTLWGLTQETYEACRFYRVALGSEWRTVASFYIAILWQSGALGLIWLGLRRSEPSWRKSAYLLGASGAALLLITALDAIRSEWTPFFNARWLAFLIAGGAGAATAVLLHRNREKLDTTDFQESALIRFIGLLSVIILGWGLTQETYAFCYFQRAELGPHWDRWAQMAISVVWSLYGALLLIGGINRHYQPVRLVALTLLSVTVIKVFLFDLSFLDGPLRMASLAGLGVSLIFISWLYGRFGTGGPAPITHSQGV